MLFWYGSYIYIESIKYRRQKKLQFHNDYLMRQVFFAFVLYTEWPRSQLTERKI
jgi:hypothetical protein